MKTVLVPDEQRYATLNSRDLRESFLVDSLFKPGEINLVWCDMDRVIIGSVVPERSALLLQPHDSMRSETFLQRRELGILNIGGTGRVEVDGEAFELRNTDGLYAGLGCRKIIFSSNNTNHPAKFYLLSYPAHAAYPTAVIRHDSVAPLELGSPDGANQRKLYKYIHHEGVRSCQLVMGLTRLATGSVWNTMPPHTHLRRSEVYLYFDLPPDARVVHLMGRGDETRHLMIANCQAVLSPGWSIHAGAGTAAYSFCWGMGGENQAFADMDAVAISELR